MDLDELAASSDVISVHVPLTDETRYLVDDVFIDKVRPGAVLINTSRGGVVEESAVLSALKDGRLSGAVLDVFESEPLDGPGGAPFADLPNLWLTPHIAGITEESNERVSRLTAKNVATHLRS